MMLPIHHNATRLTLPVVCFVLMVVGSDDSDDDVLIDEEAGSAVVTSIVGWPDQAKRPDPEILADIILYREMADHIFDNARNREPAVSAR